MLTHLLRPLRLLMPALMPSWNFFDWIAPSPRIEFRLSRHADADEPHGDWREFRARPQTLSAMQFAGRLFFNARWNESLFVASCAERLVEFPTTHSIEQIFHRIAADLKGATEADHVQFRLVFVSRQGSSLEMETQFVSEVRRISTISQP